MVAFAEIQVALSRRRSCPMSRVCNRSGCASSMRPAHIATWWR